MGVSSVLVHFIIFVFHLKNMLAKILQYFFGCKIIHLIRDYLIFVYNESMYIVYNT